MTVEFLGIAATNDGSEITARSGASFDMDYILRLARAHEEHGWDRVLFAYGSGSAGDMGRHVIPIAREQVATRDQATTGAGTGAV
jgi:hypothetical protein